MVVSIYRLIPFAIQWFPIFIVVGVTDGLAALGRYDGWCFYGVIGVIVMVAAWFIGGYRRWRWWWFCWRCWWVSRKISLKLTSIGFPWATCHTFRHTYISHLVMQGVPLITVKELVGHSDIKTTMR